MTQGSPHDDPAEALLLRFQQSGDVDALDALLRAEVLTLKERLRRRFGHLLTPTKSASDVAQDAAVGWVRIARQTDFPNPAAFRAYLLRAAFRLLARHSKKRAGRPGKSSMNDEAAPELAGESVAPDAGILGVEQRTALALALKMLPADQRILLERVYLGQKDVKTAATELGVDLETAYKRVQRGRAALAERLAAWARVLD